VVLPTGTAVLNGDDPVVAGMAELSKGAVILFSSGPFNDTLAAHCAKGGRAVFVRHGRLTVAQGAAEQSLAPMDTLPAARAHGTVAALAAAGAGIALGMAPELILAGLQTFPVATAAEVVATC
jgi:cyanophycin synthetase